MNSYSYANNHVRNPIEITWGIYSQRWFTVFKGRRDPETRDMYQRALKKLSALNDIPINEVTVYDIQSIVNSHWEYPVACSRIKLTVNQVFKRAVKEGLVAISQCPADDIEYPKKKKTTGEGSDPKRVLTEEELAVLPDIRRTQLPPVRIMLLLLQAFGLRPQEVVPLKKKDFDFDKMRLCIHCAVRFQKGCAETKSTKNGNIRYIPIPESIKDELKDHLITLTDKDYVVQLYRGEMMRRSWISQNVKRIKGLMEEQLKHALPPGFCPYTFRHNYATRTLYYGGIQKGLLSVKGAAYLMGHSEQVFISTYSHLLKDLEKEDEVANSISGI